MKLVASSTASLISGYYWNTANCLSLWTLSRSWAHCLRIASFSIVSIFVAFCSYLRTTAFSSSREFTRFTSNLICWISAYCFLIVMNCSSSFFCRISSLLAARAACCLISSSKTWMLFLFSSFILSLLFSSCSSWAIFLYRAWLVIPPLLL